MYSRTVYLYDYIIRISCCRFEGNQISMLDISNNTNLNELIISDNVIVEIDLSNNTKLQQLYANNNQITQIDLNNNAALWRVELEGNNLTTIDLSNETIAVANLKNNPFDAETEAYLDGLAFEGRITLTYDDNHPP